MTGNVVFIEDAMPLIISVMPREISGRVVDQLATGFERFFEKGERYALISCSMRGSAGMLAKERRLVADWANQPRVREQSARYCVGSATLVESAIERAALTAIMWFWTPASPHRAAASPTEAIDFCLERLGAAGLTCPMPHAKLVRPIEERIR